MKPYTKLLMRLLWIDIQRLCIAVFVAWVLAGLLSVPFWVIVELVGGW